MYEALESSALQKPAMDDAQTCNPEVEAGGSRVQSILGYIMNLKLAKVSRALVAQTNKLKLK